MAQERTLPELSIPPVQITREEGTHTLRRYGLGPPV